MTLAKKRFTAIAVAFALVIGCAFAAAAPQTAQADETKVTAGTTFKAATNLKIENKSLSASNKTQFNNRADNNYYKFKTSKRESKYKISVLSYDGKEIYGTLYDSGYHRIATFSTNTSTSTRSWVFENLQRGSQYYVELWRYATAPGGASYVDTGSSSSFVDYGRVANVFPPYKLTVKEQVIPPTLSANFGATSKEDHYLKVYWGEPSYNAEKVEIEFWWAWQKYKTVNNKFTRTANASAKSYSTKVKYFSKKYPYKVRFRPYLVANGKKIYGKWYYWNGVSSKNSQTAKRFNKRLKSTEKGVVIKPKQMTGFRAYLSTKGYLTVAWKPLASANDRVQIMMQRDGWGDNKKFFFTAKGNSARFRHNTTHPGQKYRVAIRAYHRMDGDTIYGKWSKWLYLPADNDSTLGKDTF